MTTVRAPAGPWPGIAAGLGGVALLTWVITSVGRHGDELSLTVAYPLLVLAVSRMAGTVPGLVTAAAATLTVNFFFINPVHTLRVGSASGWVALSSLAATALIAGHLAAGLRRGRAEAERRRGDADALAGLARVVLESIAPGPPGPRLAREAARVLGVEWCRIDLGPGAAAPPPSPVHAAPVSLVPAPGGFAVPLTAGGRPLGLLHVGPARAGEEPRWSTPGFADAVAGMAAIAVERGRLLEAAFEAEGLRRSDELKTALLHGVSHEFRTPLTAIRTAAAALAGGAGADGALLDVLGDETGRLDRLVGNMLDLSRLEAGGLTARTDWCAPAEIVAGALDAAAALLGGAAVHAEVEDRLPLVRADPVLTERVLVNLLHNAARHGRPPVVIEAAERDGRVEFAVSDAGPGLAAAVAARAMEPFVAGGPAGGSGIGLALARGLAQAQGAELRPPPPGGSRFVLAFEAAAVPEVVE